MAGREDCRSRSPQGYRLVRLQGYREFCRLVYRDDMKDCWTTKLTHPAKALPHASHAMTELKLFPASSTFVGLMFCRKCGAWTRECLPEKLRQPCVGHHLKTKYAQTAMNRLALGLYPYRSQHSDALARRDGRRKLGLEQRAGRNLPLCFGRAAPAWAPLLYTLGLCLQRGAIDG